MIENRNSQDTNDDIVKRLESLNKWQEEQKRLLQERQILQRQMLGMEQRKMYEMLGMMPVGVVSDGNTVVGKNNSSNSVDSCYTNLSQHVMDKSSGEGSSKIYTENLHLIKASEEKPKKPFLRRGQGLKQRFKIDPDAFRLNNLPRYKFANAHSRLVSTQGKLSKEKTKSEALTANNVEVVDIQEQRFQELLISSNKICNSTPDMKFVNSGSTNSGESGLKVRFSNVDDNTKESKNQQKQSTLLTKGINEKQCESWAKVLDNQQIKPILIHQIRNASDPSVVNLSEDPSENLSIFELLEQKANEGSIDFNSSSIQNIIGRIAQSHDDQDDIPVENNLRNAGLLPKVKELDPVVLSETDDEGEEDTTPRADSDYESTLTPEKQKTTVQVRFADDHDTHEYTEESDTSSVFGNESSEIFQQFKQALFSALQTNAMDNYIDDGTKKDGNDTMTQQTMNGSQALVSEDLQAVINLVKTRLNELENEISTFKENNMRLIKAKQEHELEKVVFAQEQLEAMDKLKDEKIQFEIYVHDERMKIENEKRKFERQMQMQKTAASSKDRKEISKYKENLDEMQSQLKQKEQAHIAAQARLRAQIRNLEKDQKQLYEEIENLKKENKHLQNENLKISRENNNKMLQEINRNIAKLAPKLAPSNSEDTAFRFKDTPPTSTCSASRIQQQKCRKKKKVHLGKKPCVDHKHSDDSLSSDCEVNEDQIGKDKNKDGRSESKCKEVTLDVNVEDVDSRASLKTKEFKREIINPDGSKDVWYSNGNVKKISPDGMLVRMLYFNKDIKETNINEGIIRYYYAETNTWHTSYLDGLEILEFPNGQTEHRYKNGIIEIHFPNDSIKVTNPSDSHIKEEWRFADGTIQKELRNGDKILILPNGQKEIHTKLNKRREYPDGTIKILYPDGSQETRYSNGRVRLKGTDGQLIMDTENGNH